MLTEEEKQEIAEELRHCERPAAAAVEALLVVQKRRGWVSDASLREAASLLGMTPAELDAVATFYSCIFRKPVGKHVIAFCDSMVCWSLGSDALRTALTAKLGIGPGETTGSRSSPPRASAPATARRPCWWMRTSTAR
jgi:NADH-quinone oxidoreductase subunit E